MTRVIGGLVACVLALGAAACWLGQGDARPREVVDVVTPAAASDA